MPVAVPFLVAVILFTIAFFTYGRFLARLFGLDPRRPTPAIEQEDGVDFVPTRRIYLLGQHFSAITAAGPIVGPIVAAIYFGWLPAFLWMLLGAIFIGAMHDFSALVGSVRHGARSVAEIIRENMTPRAFLLFLSFVWLALIYIIVAFTDVTARAFVDSLALTDGRQVAGGGVAPPRCSTSALASPWASPCAGSASRSGSPRSSSSRSSASPSGSDSGCRSRSPRSAAARCAPGTT